MWGTIKRHFARSANASASLAQRNEKAEKSEKNEKQEKKSPEKANKEKGEYGFIGCLIGGLILITIGYYRVLQLSLSPD